MEYILMVPKKVAYWLGIVMEPFQYKNSLNAPKFCSSDFN